MQRLILGFLRWFCFRGRDAYLVLAALLSLAFVAPVAAVTFSVNNTNDLGAGSLRQAILDANSLAGHDSILFSIPGSGPQVITPATLLPQVSDTVIIDGFSQPGAQSNALADGNNAVWMIHLRGPTGFIRFAGLQINASQCVIRGMQISGFRNAGVEILGGEENRVEGCYLLRNGSSGVYVRNSPRNWIGGTIPAQRNIISTNELGGIEIDRNSNGNRILGNFIGTDTSGNNSLGNKSTGVALSSSGTQVGGVGAGEGNRISFNRTGVEVFSGTNHIIRGNSIHSNTEYGISLGGFTVILNDPGDVDEGPNRQQNFPVLTKALVEGENVTVEGTLNSLPNRSYVIDFYANRQCNQPIYDGDLNRYGEGEIWLRSLNVSSDSQGNATISSTFAFSEAAGKFITATATDPDGNTSEFSECVVTSRPLATDVILVTNANDTGPGSLRAALEEVDFNGNLPPDRIEFAVPGAGPHVIELKSPLPSLTLPVVIDGFSQPGSRRNSLVDGNNSLLAIRLDGSGSGFGANGLVLATNGIVIRGLSLSAFPRAHISIQGQSNVVEGNWIGVITNANQVRAPIFGVEVRLNAWGNSIGGTSPESRNIISGNQIGLSLEGDNNLVQGNFIGTSLDGFSPLPNASTGLTDSGFENVIGGGLAGAGNVISGNKEDGVELRGAGAVVEGNLIGVDPSGKAPLPNGYSGIYLGGDDHRIGGKAPGSANVISGNGHDGINLRDAESINITIQNNSIGSDLSGSVRIGNKRTGLDISRGGEGILIGGVQAGNRIAFNDGAGLYLSAPLIQVLGNSIYQNGKDGIVAEFSSNRIGGTLVGEGNLVSSNGYYGILVNNFEIPIRGNRIFGNGFEEIRHAVLSHNGSVYGYGNNRQPAPIIDSAIFASSVVTIRGSMRSAPNAVYQLDLFRSADCPEGDPQGEHYLTSVEVLTNAEGLGSFEVVASGVPAGSWITATATSRLGNTSEFSACRGVNLPTSADLKISQFVPHPLQQNGEGELQIVALNHGPQPASGVIVSNFLPASATFVSASSERGAISHQNGVVQWNVGNLAPDEKQTLTIRFVPGVAGSVTNRVTVVGNPADVALANNESHLRIQVRADPFNSAKTYVWRATDRIDNNWLTVVGGQSNWKDPAGNIHSSPPGLTPNLAVVEIGSGEVTLSRSNLTLVDLKVGNGRLILDSAMLLIQRKAELQDGPGLELRNGAQFTIAANGRLEFKGGPISGGGPDTLLTLQTGAVMQVSQPGSRVAVSTFRNDGLVRIENSGQLFLSNSAPLMIEGGGGWLAHNHLAFQSAAALHLGGNQTMELIGDLIFSSPLNLFLGTLNLTASPTQELARIARVEIAANPGQPRATLQFNRASAVETLNVEIQGQTTILTNGVLALEGSASNVLNGNLANRGEFRLDQGATTKLQGDFTQFSEGMMVMRISDPVPNALSRGLRVAGNVILNGSIDFEVGLENSRKILPVSSYSILFSEGGPLPPLSLVQKSGERIHSRDDFGSFVLNYGAATENGRAIVLNQFRPVANSLISFGDYSHLLKPGILTLDYTIRTNANWSDASRWSSAPLVPNNGNGGLKFDAKVSGRIQPGTIIDKYFDGIYYPWLYLEPTVFLDQDVTLENVIISTNARLVATSAKNFVVNEVMEIGDGVVLEGPGTTVVRGRLEAGRFALRGRQLVNEGQSVVLYPPELQNGSVLSNAAGATLTLALGPRNEPLTPRIKQFPGNNLIINAGTLIKSRNGYLGILLPFENRGTLLVREGGWVFYRGQTFPAGTFQVDPPGVLRFASGNYLLEPGATVIGAGDVQIGTASVVRNPDNFNSVFPPAKVEVRGLYQVGGTTRVDRADLILNNPNATLGTLALLSGSIYASNQIVISNLVWESGRLGGTGTKTLIGTAKTVPTSRDGSEFTFREVRSGILNNQGTFNHENGTITVSDGGAIRNHGVFVLNGFSRIVQGSLGKGFENEGLVRKTGVGSASIAVAVTGKGDFQVDQGQLYLVAGNLGDTSFQIAKGASLALAGIDAKTVPNIGPGTSFSGEGELILTNGTLRIGRGFNITRSMRGGNGNLILDGPVSILPMGSLELRGGTFSLNKILEIEGAVENQGLIRLQGGLAEIRGNLRNLGNLVITQGHFNVTGTFINQGQFEFSGGDFTLNNGQFRNLGRTKLQAGGVSMEPSAVFFLARGGLLHFDNDSVLNVTGTFGQSSSATNEGMILKTRNGSASLPEVLENSGWIEIRQGSFYLRDVRQSGSGRICLRGGTLFFTLPRNITGGVLAGSGSIGSHPVLTNVRVEPGNPIGELRFDHLPLTAGSTLAVQIGGAQKGVSYDSISTSNGAVVSGNLEITFWNGFQRIINSAETFVVLESQAENVTGQLSNVVPGARLQTSDRHGSFEVHYGPSSAFGANKVVLAKFQPAAIPVLTPTPPVFSRAVMEEGTFRLEFSGEAARGYEVQVSADLQNWRHLLMLQPDATGLVQFTDPTVPVDEVRAYRVLTW